MIGTTVAHYDILEKIGEGGMGVVYKALDTRLEREVALKFLSVDFTGSEELKERFILEAKAASVLDHPNICTIHAIEETDDGRLFIAMGYYPGETIKAKLKNGPLPWVEIVDMSSQIANGLEAAHERGIIHMDVKPANLMVTPEGTVKILDFGLSRFTSELDRTRPEGPLMGTVAYMSPEQVQNEETGPESDLWALGVVMYEMATGSRPFHGKNDMAVLYSIVHKEVPAPGENAPELPADLDRIICRSLVKDRRQRYQCSAEVLAELEPLKQNSHFGTDAFPVFSAQALRRQKLLQRLTALVAVLALVVLAFILSILNQDPGGSIEVSLAEMAEFPPAPGGEWIGPALREAIRLGLQDIDELSWIEPQDQDGGEWIIDGSFSPDLEAAPSRLELELRVTHEGSEPRLLTLSGEIGEVADKLAGELAGMLDVDRPVRSQPRPALPTRAAAAEHLKRARELLILLDSEAAIDELDKAEKLEPGNALVHISWATALWQLGHEDDSQQKAEEAVSAARYLARDVRIFVAALSLQTHYETERAASLLKILWHYPAERWESLPVDRFDLGLSLADVLYESAQTEAALGILGGLAAERPGHPRVLLLEGRLTTVGQEKQETFARVAEIAESSEAFVLQARALALEGQAWVRLGDVEQATARLNAAREFYASQDHAHGEADVLLVLALMQWGRQNLLEAKDYYADASRLFGSAGSHRGLFKALSNQGRILADYGELGAALQVLTDARQTWREKGGDPAARIAFLINLGEVWTSIGKYDEARLVLEEDLKILSTGGDPVNEAIALATYGWLHFMQGDLPQADQKFTQALAIQVRNKDQYRFGTLYYRSYLFRARGELARAYDDVKEFLELSKDTPAYHARGLTALAHIQMLQGRLDLAHESFEKARGLQVTNTYWGSQTTLGLARLQLEEGEFQKAEALAREALGNLTGSPAVPDISSGHVLLAQSLLAQGKYQPAQEAVDKASQLLEGIDSPVFRIPVELCATRLAAHDDVQASMHRLQTLLGTAMNNDFMEMSLWIRLALREVEIRAGNNAARTRLLNLLAPEAESKGYVLISRKAQELARSEP